MKQMGMARLSQKAQAKPSRRSAENAASAPFLHPLLHRRFGEELFYFLIAVKPYDHIKSFEALHKAMSAFGISKYCAYQIFGQFDMLVRVWLPAGQSQDFIELVVGEMHYLRSMIEFHVTRTSESWRFSENLEEEAKELATHITPRQIKEIQEGKNATLLGELKDAGIYKIIEDYLSKNPKSIKAFIAISEPNSASRDRRDAIFKEIIEKLKKIPDADQTTVYSGYGFTWALIKIVLTDYYAIGKLVDDLATVLKGDGISTSTYLVAGKNYQEGECIGRRALENKEGDENVRLLLPELYSTSDIEDGFKDSLELFVKQKIIGAGGLDFEDKLALQGFLRAVISNSAIAAFTALFPSFVKTEQDLRQLLIIAAEKTTGKMTGLVQAIDPDKKYIKNVKTMPLAMVLKGCAHLAKQSVDAQTFSLDDIPMSLIDSLTNARNRIMHGSEFEPRLEWHLFAQSLVDLASVRSRLKQQLSKYDQEKKSLPTSQTT